MFPEELVKRAAGKDIPQRTKKTEDEFAEFLDKKRESSNIRYKSLKKDRKNKIKCLECKGNPNNFNIYKSDIAEIKKRIPTSVDGYIGARKVYFSYLVAYKRLESMNKPLNIPCTENSKNDVTYSCIEQLSGLSRKSVEKAVKVLQEQRIIKYHNREERRTCELLFVPEEKCIDKLYYNGINYMKAFNIMNRHLSR